MLSAQVEYWKLQETSRHNLTTEAQGWANYRETARHNVVSEQLGFNTLVETVRHNQATEAETARHNIVSEQQGFANLAETERSHRASEAINWANVAIAQEKVEQGWESLSIERDLERVQESRATSAALTAQAAASRARTEQYRAETERTYREEDIQIRQDQASQGWLNTSNQEYHYSNEADRWSAQTAQGWANWGLNAANLLFDVAGVTD